MAAQQPDPHPTARQIWKAIRRGLLMLIAGLDELFMIESSEKITVTLIEQ